MKALILFLMFLSLPVGAAETQSSKPLEIQENTYIELRGTPERIQSLLDKVTKEDAFRTAQCQIIPANKESTKSKSEKTEKSCEKVVGISCVNPGCSLADMFKESGVQYKLTSTYGYGCPSGCIRIACPPVNGLIGCCKKVGAAFFPCTP